MTENPDDKYISILGGPLGLSEKEKNKEERTTFLLVIVIVVVVVAIAVALVYLSSFYFWIPKVVAALFFIATLSAIVFMSCQQ